jgi:hypothetical protein
MNKNFYNSTKVGIILNVDSISFAKAGGQGLLDMALTPGNKYTEPLKTVEPFVKPTEKVKNEIEKILGSKNKQFEFINEKIDFETMKKFEKPSSGGNYYKRDLRELKAKYNVDELMIVNAKYGILVTYIKGLIEAKREGYSNINTSIVNLNDNSLLFQDNTKSLQKIQGEWKTPPNYDNLKNAIQVAIDASLLAYKLNF